jgi:type III pantothenate kinase
LPIATNEQRSKIALIVVNCSSMILVLDIGNTRIKWARLEGGQLSAQSAVAHTEDPQAAIHRLLDAAVVGDEIPRRIVASNVGGEHVAKLCAQTCARRFGLEPEFLEACRTRAGVTNAYLEPAKLGVDRWLAMIGGFSLVRGSVCVVSVGTALTIDVVDATGRHLGGVIAPGPTLMRESLLRNTSEIATRMREEKASASLLANHTQAAVVNGCEHALAALIERVYREALDRVDESPKLLLTGGAVASLVSLIGPAHEIVEDLVLRGIAAVISPSAAPDESI